MDRTTNIVVIAALIASVVGADKCHAVELSEVIIADEVRTAYYEHAPRLLAAAMSKAVDSWCSAAKASKSDTSGWLCQRKKLVYFRSVYVTGTKGRHGLVCENDGTSSLKYFGVDLVSDVVADGSCVSAEFDGTKYQLYVERPDSRDDT